MLGLVIGSFSPPYIDSIEPLNNINKVTFNAPFTVHFSHLMNKNSVESAFQIIPNTTGNFEWKDGKTLEFHPKKELEINKEFEINISKNAQSLWFKKIGSDQSIKYIVTGPPYLQFKHPEENEVIREGQAVTLMFDRPMDFSETNKSKLLEIKPKMDGEIKYIGKSAFQFTPKNLKSNQSYEITLNPGLLASDGGETEELIQWNLRTPSNGVQGSNLEDDVRIDINQAIEIEFNTAIELEKIRPGANALLFPSNDIDANINQKDDGFFNTEVRYAINEEGEAIKNKLVFEPTFPYLHNKNYQFILKAEGVLNLEKDFELNFETVEDPNAINAESNIPIEPEAIEIDEKETLAWQGNIERHFFIRGENPHLKLENPLKKEATLDVCQISSNKFIELSASNKLRTYQCEEASTTIKKGVQDIDLNESHPQEWVTGIYYASIDDDENKIWSTFSIQDVSLSIKKSDNELLVWANDIKTGKVIEEMEVELISYDGTKIEEGNTDENGLFYTQKKLEKGIYIRAKKETENLTRWGFLNESWKLNSESEKNDTAEEIKIFLNTNQLSAGEEIKVKGIWREERNYQLQLSRSEQVVISLRDERNNLIFDKRIPLRRNGSFDTSIQLPEQATDGLYELLVSDINNQLINKPIELQINSKEPQVELEWKNEKAHYNQREIPTFQAQARYKNGLPASEKEGYFKLYKKEHDLNYKNGATDFSFISIEENCKENCWEETLINEGVILFDNEGEASFSFTNGSKGLLKGNSTYTVEIQVEESQLTHEFTLHQGLYELGLGVPHAINEPGEKIEFELITTNQDGELISDKEINVKLFKTDNQRDVIFEKNYTTENKELSLTNELDSKIEAGIYTLQASSRDKEKNEIIAEKIIYIKEGDEKEISNKLMLIADQESYLVGGRAKLIINEDSASEDKPVPLLISYERNGLIDFEFMELTKPITNLNIPIKNEMLPHFLVKATRFDRGVLPDYIEAEIALKVENERHDINLKMNLDFNVENKDKVIVNFETQDFQKNPISTVITLNAASRSLKNYQLKADDFFTPTAKAFTNSSNIGKYTQEIDPLITQEKVTQKLNHRYDSYYFNPLIQTDENGLASVEIELPNNNKELHLQAIASSKTLGFGSANKTINLNKGFSIRPILPNFVSRGDQTVFAAIVKNISEEAISSQFNIDSNGVAFQGDQTRNISLQPGQQTELSFNVFIDQSIKEEALKINFTAGEDKLEKLLPVRSIKNTLDLIQNSQMDDLWSGRVSTPKNAHFDQQKLSLKLSATPLSLSNKIRTAIESYPYKSNHLKVIELITKIEGLNEASKDEVNDLSFLTNILQNESIDRGAYAAWPNAEANIELTAMAAMALGKAQKKGVIIDELKLKQSLEYLLETLNNQELTANTQLMILWGLAENEQFDTEKVLTLFREREGMDHVERALLLINLEQIKEAGQTSSIAFIERLKGEIIDEIIRQNDTAFFEGESKEAATAANLYALSLSDNRNPILEAMINYLSNKNLNVGKRFNPIKGMWQVLAFDAYADELGKKELNYITKIKLNGRSIVDQSVTTQDLETVYEFEEVLTNTKSEEMSDIFLRKEGVGPLYFDLQLEYNEDPEKISPKEENLILVREFRSLDGEVIDKLKVGESYESHLTLVVPTDLKNVVINDPSNAGTRTSKKEVFNQYFEHVEVDEMGISYMTTFLPAGVYELSSIVKASIPGNYHNFPAEALSLFESNVYAQSEFKLIEISE